MLFDSMQAERLYRSYLTSGNIHNVALIHQLSIDLIKVIAGSIDRREHFDDLVQEGHLKLQAIIINQAYKLDTKCSMYTFLSYCLRNSMIDYMRKLRSYDALDDCDACTITPEIVWDNSYFDFYYQQRFPSLGASGTDVTAYIRDAIFECSNRSKVITTITDLYGLLRNQANLLHNSVSLFLKLSYRLPLDEKLLANSLNYAHNGSEMTLRPESVLVGKPDVTGYKELLLSVHNL